ncbi:hypothetical protein ALC62_10702 [Cyphomyrmex costatus]|uniref:Uncharacterized protein n=1 Tax=Cyphomyrmex costatus TaxID=456900 RepID=A0A195CCZ5_9HYME|nr:hypothetical protein ALC62_10702 [Cyphomyrmex costatus]
MTPWNRDPMAIRTNSDSFVPPKITTKYTAVRNVRLACSYACCTSKTHQCTAGVPLVHRRIPGNVPGRTVERTAAATTAVGISRCYQCRILGRELLAICHWCDSARCNSAALSARTPAPREGEFHGHLSHGIIGKHASSREWPLAHNVGTVHTNVGQAL